MGLSGQSGSTLWCTNWACELSSRMILSTGSPMTRIFQQINLACKASFSNTGCVHGNCMYVCMSRRVLVKKSGVGTLALVISRFLVVTWFIGLVNCCGVNKFRLLVLCQVSWLAHGLPCQCGRNHTKLESLGKSWLSMPSNGCVSTHPVLQSPKPELVLLSVPPRHYKISMYFSQFAGVRQPTSCSILRFSANANAMKADLYQPDLTDEDLHDLLLKSIGHWNVQEACPLLMYAYHTSYVDVKKYTKQYKKSNILYCWWKNSCTTWGARKVLKTAIKTTFRAAKVVQDFVHQPHVHT